MSRRRTGGRDKNRGKTTENTGRNLRIEIGKTEIAMRMMKARDSFQAAEQRASASSVCAFAGCSTSSRANTAQGLQGSTNMARVVCRARSGIHMVSTVWTKEEKVMARRSYFPEKMRIDNHINGAMGGHVATPCEAPWELARDMCPVETIRHPHPEMVDQFLLA